MRAQDVVLPVAEKLTDTGVKMMDKANEFSGQMREELGVAYRKGARAARLMREKAEDKSEEVRLNIRENPFSSVAIAAGAGLLLGATLGWWIGHRNRE